MMNATSTAHIHLDSLLNPDVFLYNSQTWTRAIASALAHQDGLPERPRPSMQGLEQPYRSEDSHETPTLFSLAR